MVQLVRVLARQPVDLLQQAVISLLYALPFIFGLLLATAGASVKLAAAASLSALSRIPETAERLSSDWSRRAIMAGFPYLWQRQLKKFFHGTAVLMIVGSWLLMLFTIAFMGSRLF